MAISATVPGPRVTTSPWLIALRPRHFSMPTVYADWAHEIPATHANLRAYRGRLLVRPSVARAADEARPFRSYFPPGAPDRD